MKLESIKTYVVGNPPPSFGGRYFVFVKDPHHLWH